MPISVSHNMVIDSPAFLVDTNGNVWFFDPSTRTVTAVAPTELPEPTRASDNSPSA